MTTYAAFGRKLKSVNLTDITKDAMIANADNIAQLNRDQMLEGKRSDESFIEPEYNRFTVAQKQLDQQRFDVVTLKDTGAFQSKIYLTIQGNQYSLYSSDEKAASLTNKYDERIWGLTPANQIAAWRGFLRYDVTVRVRQILR